MTYKARYLDSNISHTVSPVQETSVNGQKSPGVQSTNRFLTTAEWEGPLQYRSRSDSLQIPVPYSRILCYSLWKSVFLTPEIFVTHSRNLLLTLEFCVTHTMNQTGAGLLTWMWRDKEYFLITVVLLNKAFHQIEKCSYFKCKFECKIHTRVQTLDNSTWSPAMVLHDRLRSVSGML